MVANPIVAIGQPQAPILTLDLAQRIGLQTCRQAVAELEAELAKARDLLRQATQAVGLDPDIDYAMDADGHVFGPAPAAEGGTEDGQVRTDSDAAPEQGSEAPPGNAGDDAGQAA